MKSLTLAFAFFMAFNPLNQTKLPTKWGKEFTITLYYSNVMGNTFEDIRFTYDECNYKFQNHEGKTTEYTFKLTEASRIEILKKLRELKIESVKSAVATAPVNDGWSRSICFGVTCLEGGSGATMSDSHKNIFLDAYNYLEQFAVEKKGQIK